jgi:hypothetical protein
MEEKLAQIYNNPSNPAGFTGIDSLFKEAKKVVPKIRRKDVEHFLQGHRTYSLTKPRRTRFKRVKTVPLGYMTDLQADLADMQSLADHNDGNRYILVGIDVLSKMMFAKPIKSKRADDVLEAMRQMIEEMPQKPWRIYTDLGTEFKNSQLKEFLKNEEITKLMASSPFQKASLAERSIRTLKQRLYRYFHQYQTKEWTKVLPKIVKAINHSKSRVIGMRPIDVNPDNAQALWNKQYAKDFFGKNKAPPKFKKGDFVRMSLDKGIFEKGYITNWGDEILEIDQVKDTSKPYTYKVKDEKGEEFKGHFYGPELSKVRKDDKTEYRVEKILRTRKRKDGKKEYLIKFIGYSDPLWIHEKDLIDLNKKE